MQYKHTFPRSSHFAYFDGFLFMENYIIFISLNVLLFKTNWSIQMSKIQIFRTREMNYL